MTSHLFIYFFMKKDLVYLLKCDIYVKLKV